MGTNLNRNGTELIRNGIDLTRNDTNLNRNGKGLVQVFGNLSGLFIKKPELNNSPFQFHGGTIKGAGDAAAV
jgi:hypothetical protein